MSRSPEGSSPDSDTASALESAYLTPLRALAQIDHGYGDRVHILSDPYALGLLARLCSPSVCQPEFNRIVEQLYRHLMVAVVNAVMPCVVVESKTRMITASRAGVFRGSVLDSASKVVCVDVARAGMLPSQVCYEMANCVFEPDNVRQDHVVMSRRVDASGRVVGSDLTASKIGGSIDGRFVFFPDPMGATGESLSVAIAHYLANHGSQPAGLITLNLIVTPQFIRALTTRFPDVRIFALRVDRGASSAEVLSTPLGQRWSEEDGLTDKDYIVPGGGGFGELMNNSWV